MIAAGPGRAPAPGSWRIMVAVVCLALLPAPATFLGQLAPLLLPHERTPIIVLDPGRGGSNQGVQGPTGLLEKDITLAMATEAGRLIEELLGVRVVLTRTDDSEVALEARAALANQAGADLFISIHAGGSFAPARREFQTFYFDAMQQSLSSGRELPTPGGLSAEAGSRRRGVGGSSPVILWDQAQLDFLETSQMFARLLNNNLRAQVAEEGRGVVGLPSLLLRWVRMPAVLLDLGSLTDPGFEAKWRDDAYPQRVALGIAQAVNDYYALQR